MPCGGKTSFVSACKRGWGDEKVFRRKARKLFVKLFFFTDICEQNKKIYKRWKS